MKISFKIMFKGVCQKLRYGYIAPPLLSKRTIFYIVLAILYIVIAKM